MFEDLLSPPVWLAIYLTDYLNQTKKIIYTSTFAFTLSPKTAKKSRSVSAYFLTNMILALWHILPNSKCAGLTLVKFALPLGRVGERSYELHSGVVRQMAL